MKNQQQNKSEHNQPQSQAQQQPQASQQGQKGKTGDNTQNDATTKQKGGGYSSEPEQHETKREQKNMHNERDLDELDANEENTGVQENKADKKANDKPYTTTAPKPGQARK